MTSPDSRIVICRPIYGPGFYNIDMAVIRFAPDRLGLIEEILAGVRLRVKGRYENTCSARSGVGLVGARRLRGAAIYG